MGHNSQLGGKLSESPSLAGRPESQRVRQFRQQLSKISVQKQVTQAIAQALAEAARAMNAGAADFSRLASGAGQSVQGSVRLSASQPVAFHLLPPVLARMRQALPQVSVELVVSNSVSNLLLREADISTKKFRELTGEVARLLAYEATADFPLEKTTLQCWSGPTEVDQIAGRKVTVVPILRAGLGMLDGVLDILPNAQQAAFTKEDGEAVVNAKGQRV